MISICEMTIQDISQVSEMMCSCYRWLGRENGFSDKQVEFLVSERGSPDTIKAESQSQTYLIACINGLIVGVVAVKANEVAKLFVDPAFHGQSIGSMLFNSAQKLIAKDKYEEMIVGVMAQSAIGFYKKMGMSKFDEKILQAGVFAGCKTPLMRKVLLHA